MSDPLVHTRSEEAQTAAWPRAPLLLCSSSSRTGPVEGLIALAAHLRAQGIDARFGGDTVRPGEDLPGHLARAGVPLVESLRLSRKVKAGDLIHDARLLTSWVREGAPDLIQCAFAHDHALALWAARRSGAARERLRVVREAHRRVDVSPGRLGLRRRLLAASDGVVVRCEAYRDALVAQGLDPRRVAAIPGVVDSTRFTPGRTPEAHRLRALWGIPANAVLLGMVARMKPERLQTRLVDEFYRALHDSPDAHLVLVGRGEDEEALRALAQRLAPERIRFGGYVRGPDLVDAYRALDVAVWLREGNDGACRGVLEAMACGVPLIVGNDGAPPELVAGSRADPCPQACGRVVDPLLPGALAKAIVELAGSESLRARLGKAARERSLRFTNQRAGEATLSFWRSLGDLPPVSGTVGLGGPVRAPRTEADVSQK
jgi:glycosyltransferase involved in cell wall biosynthesis